ncbi:DUF1801 domain-containing protein [Candidatus Palauibacter sp.]|uniref:DUF1801 domain-containing protein n=1 Tax=Candidatus Palauibacter sp. TaxID=3101350 RepID=UPI003B5982C4
MKTRPSDASVDDFLARVGNERRRRDALAVLALMKRVTGEEPVMWGDSIVGFGSYHYRYASGREGDWPLAGFSPRKRALTVYIMSGFAKHDQLLSRLGKHATGKSCLYINRLEDVDMEVLRELVECSVAEVSARYAVDA